MQHTLAVHGYLALFPLAVLEGPAVSVFAAFLASRGVLDLLVVYGLVVAADLAGDLLYYAAGRWLLGWLHARRRPWGPRLARRVEALAPRIRDHAGKVLLVGKLTHSAGFAVLLAAGAARVRIATFMAYNLLGSVIKSAVLVAIGYWFGKLYGGLQGELQLASAAVLLLALLGLGLLARRLAPLADAALTDTALGDEAAKG